MAISRPVLLALLGAVLFGATALAVQNARTGSDSDATPAAVQTDPAPTGTQPSANSTPEQTLQQAFDLGSVQSGKFALRLRLADRAELPAGHLAGAFQKGAQGDLPDFELHGRLADDRQTTTVGFRSVGDKAYFTKGETGWRVPPRDLGPASPTASPSAAPRAALLPDPSRHLGRQGRVQGQRPPSTACRPTTCPPPSTRRPSSRISLRRPRPTASPGCRSQRRLARVVKRAQLDVWVGADDHIVRRAVAVAGFAGNARMALDLRLTDVNKPQQIESPSTSAPVRRAASSAALANGLVRGASGRHLPGRRTPAPTRAAPREPSASTRRS